MSLLPKLAPTLPCVETERGWITAVPFYLIATAATLLFIFTTQIGYIEGRTGLQDFGPAWLKPKTVKPAAIVLWCSATLAIVPPTLAAFHAELHKAEYLNIRPATAARFGDNTADLVLRWPIIGAGIAATRYIDEHASNANVIPGSDVPAGPNVHSHNVFLRTWHEMGCIGALLLCLAGLRTIKLIGRQSRNDQAYLFAPFSAVAVIASLSWSLIAAWFIAAFSLTAIFAQLACHLSRDILQKTDGSPSPPQKHEESPEDPITAACSDPVSGQRG